MDDFFKKIDNSIGAQKKSKSDFNEMKNLLEVTDGNLASHSSALEKASYIEIKKEFVGKKPKTSYRVTNAGRQAFTEHINALEKLLGK